MRNLCGCGGVKLQEQSKCDSCVQEQQHSQIIRDYIHEHPNANVMMISQGTGLSVEKILRLIKDGSFLIRNRF